MVIRLQRWAQLGRIKNKTTQPTWLGVRVLFSHGQANEKSTRKSAEGNFRSPAPTLKSSPSCGLVWIAKTGALGKDGIPTCTSRIEMRILTQADKWEKIEFKIIIIKITDSGAAREATEEKSSSNEGGAEELFEGRRRWRQKPSDKVIVGQEQGTGRETSRGRRGHGVRKLCLKWNDGQTTATKTQKEEQQQQQAKKAKQPE